MVPLALLILAADPAGQTLAENIAAARALHRRIDGDGDGYVTWQETMAAAAAFVAPREGPLRLPESRVARQAFDRADLNHDGRISMAEAVAGATQAFHEADTNHDGLLSASERGAYAARALTALEREAATWPAPPCHPDAPCARRSKGDAPEGTPP